MDQKDNLNTILLATSSFIGGIAAGLLLSPRKGAENRAWLSSHFKDLHNRKFTNLRFTIYKRIKQNFPDLYEATENIRLSKNHTLR